MLGRLFEGFEERLVGFLFWAAIFVPLMIGAGVVAHRYRVVDDMLAGTNAPAPGSDGDWMSIGTSVTSWTPAPPPPPLPTEAEAPKDANGEAAGGGAKSTSGAPAGVNPKMASKGATRPTKDAGSSGEGTGTGDGTGAADGEGTGVKIRPEGAGGVVGSKKPCLEPIEEIRAKGTTSWEVDRSLLEYYSKHLKEFDDLAVTLPSFDDDGKPAGFRLTGMRCGNPLHQGGFRNGDVIHTVNGKRVNTVVQAAVTYAKLRDEEYLVVAITRKGAAMELEYYVEE